MALFNPLSFRRYFANTSWLLVERILRMGINLLVGVYVIRYLGPEQFGQLSYAMSFVGIFSVVAMLGLDHTVIRNLVKETTHPQELLGTAFGLKLIGAIIAIFFVVAACSFTSNSIEENILVLIVAAGLLFQSVTVIDFHFQARVQSRYVVYAQVVQLVISSIAKLSLVWSEASLFWFAAVVLIDAIVFAFGLVIVYINTGHNPKSWRYNSKLARILIRDSWPLMLSAIAISLYMKIDQVMIKEMIGAEAVGHYAAAVRISEIWYFVPVAIAGSLFPAMINMKEKSEERYYYQLQKLFDLMVFLAVVIALPISFMSEWIVMLLFGKAYLAAGAVLSIHVWSAVFVFLGCAIGRSFVVDNNQSLNLYRNILGLITNIVLNLMLIPVLGIKGAALSTFVSYLVSAYLAIPFFASGRKQFVLATRSLFPLRVLAGKKSNN